MTPANDSSTKPQLVEAARKQPNKCHGVQAPEACHIAPKVRQLIADEFQVVQSSRKLARKYRMSIHVIQDIVLLHLRREPPRERLTVVDVFQQRRTA